MAARFWVGGTGTWDAVTTTNWSATSGGAGGASVPTSADTVTIDTNSGTGTCTMATGLNPTVNSFTFTPSNFTCDLSNNALTCVTYSSSVGPTGTQVARVLAFGTTGQIIVTGNNATIAQWRYESGLTYTGSKKFVLNYAGSVGTRTVSFPSYNSTNALPNIYVTAGSDTVAGTGASGIVTGDVDFTGFSGKFQTGQWFLYGNLTLSSTMTASGTPSGTLYFTQTSGTYTVTNNGAPWTVTGLLFPFTGTSSANWIFKDANITMPPTVTFNSGTLDFSNVNTNVTSAGTFISSSGSGRTIKWGNGSFTLSGTNSTIMDFGNETNMTFTGTPPVIQVTGNGTSGQTRTINVGTSGLAASRALSFNITQGTDTVAMNGGFNNLTFQPSWTGALGGGSKTIYGNVTFHSAMTHASSLNSITFAPQGANTIVFTTAGVTINSPIINSASATTGVTKISGNLIQSVANTNTLTQSLGTLDIGNNTVNTWSYTANIAGVHGLTSNGAATMNLTGSNAVVANVSMTNWTMTGNLQFNLVGNPSSGTRTIAISNASSAINNIDINVLGGTDNVTFTGSALDVNFTGFSGALAQSTNVSIYGNLVMSNTMTVATSTSQIQFVGTGNNTIQTNNTVIQMPIGFNSTGNYQLQDNVTLSGFSSNVYSIQYNGNLDLNNNTLTCPSWQISGGRSINFGTSGQMILTGTNGTLWSAPAITTFRIFGNDQIIANSANGGNRVFNNGGASGASELNAITIDISSGGSDTLSFLGYFSNIDLTGWSGTWTNQATTMYGNLTFPSGATALSGNSVLTFAGNNTSYTFDTSDVAINFPIVVNASNTTVTWANDVVSTSTSPTLTISSGNLVVNGNVTVGNIVLSGTSTRSIDMGNATWTFNGTGNVWNQTANSVVCNIIPDNSTVVFSNDTALRNINIADGTTLNNVVVMGNTLNSDTIFNGNITINNISDSYSQSAIVRFSGGTTTNFTSFNITGANGSPITLTSTTAIPHNLVLLGNSIVNTVDYLTISYSNASPISDTWYAGGNSINGGNVTGWIFNTESSNFFLLF